VQSIAGFGRCIHNHSTAAAYRWPLSGSGHDQPDPSGAFQLLVPLLMKTSIFLWGLSNGIIALTIAALFWLGLGLGPGASKAQWYVDALVMLAVYGCCGAGCERRAGLRR
jgi:hypothetical protein